MVDVIPAVEELRVVEEAEVDDEVDVVSTETSEVIAAPVGVAPSALPGMADPTPLLVNGIGIGSSDVFGLSAGS